MSHVPNRPIEALRHFQLLLCRQLEFASAEIAELNEILARLGFSEQLAGTAILGEVVYQRAYNPGQGPDDSGQVFQAAIVFPKGFGSVLWDSEDFVRFHEAGYLPIDEAVRRFVSFDSCTPTAQCRLLPQIRPLVEDLCRLVWPS